MSGSSQLLEDAVEAAKRAVKFDTDGKYEAAAYFYNVSSKLLLRASEVVEPEKAESLKQKSSEYKHRASKVNELNSKSTHSFEEDDQTRKLKQFKFLMQQALDADGAAPTDTVVELYSNAVEFMTKHPELMQEEIRELTVQALERAEELKGIRSDVAKNVSAYETTSLKVSGSAASYTEEEKLVLFHSSRINNIDYVPFMSVDLKERFQYAIPFTDKDGLLALAPKQRKDLHKWVRPEEICSDPCIVMGAHPDYYSIKQTVVSDCSFVASLAVSALYEKRFGRQLVTRIIYPRTKDKRPLYNPFGKYMVKLHVNGVTRKVIIDDQLPANRYGQLLCSYSSNKNEFWISLLEKAYMKVMGGYDFPGSNSNIDLHALTGWIPEREPIRSKAIDFNRDGLFAKIESRMAKGDVLVTVATGEMSDADADRTGLVATHAYAVMDVRTTSDGVRLLKLKNPWSHLRWRGNYSELDSRHWTPRLQAELGYDPNSAAHFDNGVFWIDYDSICAFFEVFYLNWNPELFNYTYCVHQIVQQDMLDFRNPPQNNLILQIILKKINDRAMVNAIPLNYGRSPADPPPYIDGVRINSPHYLCKIILGPESSRKYTLVISQYEKTATIYYTLRVYSTCPFKLNKIVDQYKYKKEVSGEWKGPTAGGCGNHPATCKNNPTFRLEVNAVSNENYIAVELRGPKQYQIGFDVTISKVSDDSVTAPFRTTSSGAYRSGFVILALENIPAGVLHISPSTFLPGQEGPFFLTIKSSAPIELR